MSEIPPATKAPLTKEERRARKQLRRENQRRQNAVRALKMRALRLQYEVEHAQTRLPSKPASNTGPSYHIGCSGWFYWHLRETFYKSLPTREWFNEYTRHFRTVEINASFYSWPTEANVKTWIKQAGRKRFIYTVKVSELITYIKRFRGTSELIRDFGYIADMLGPRMGCFLFQLPPSFKYSAARLKMILRQLDPRHRNVVEFRHASWWRENVYAAFREAGAIFCSCSGPRLPDELVRTSDDVYIRFHGVDRWYRHDYSDAEIADWIQRIKTSGAKRVWVYFNNDFDGFAIKNAKQMMRQLKKQR